MKNNMFIFGSWEKWVEHFRVSDDFDNISNLEITSPMQSKLFDLPGNKSLASLFKINDEFRAHFILLFLLWILTIPSTPRLLFT